MKKGVLRIEQQYIFQGLLNQENNKLKQTISHFVCPECFKETRIFGVHIKSIGSRQALLCPYCDKWFWKPTMI